MQTTREQFDALVRDVEKRFSGRARALRVRLALMAALGYVGLLGGFFFASALAALFFLPMPYVDFAGRIFLGSTGGLILIVGSWSVLRVLLIRLTPPEGRALSREEAPGLHRMLDQVRQSVHSTPFHRVLVTAACNASVVQVPRLGIFGWSRNYLLLGLPLLEQLPSNEMRAVVAHEFAHLSKEHGRFSRWIYRLRISWQRIFEEMARPIPSRTVSLRPLILKFVDWFWPRFNAHAFVLSRLNEYEADSVAARVTGTQSMAMALQRIAILNRHLDESFWPEIWKTANREAQPPAEVLVRLHRTVAAGMPPEDRERWLVQAQRMATTNDDTHPCLTDRLRALAQSPLSGAAQIWTAPLLPSASELLGEKLATVRNDVDQQWRKTVTEVWRDRHGRANALQDRLQTLEQPVPTAVDDAERLWDRARITIDLHGDEPAKPLLQEILTRYPDHASANFHFGRVLLADDDPAGESYVERAMKVDSQWIHPACGLLGDHFRRMGRMDRVKEIAVRLDQHDAQLAASRVERSSVSAADSLIEHGLSGPELEALRVVLANDPDLSVASLARKQLRHFPDQKMFLLCVEGRRRWILPPNADLESAMVRRLTKSVVLPGRVLVFAPRGDFSALGRKLRRRQGVAVYLKD